MINKVCNERGIFITEVAIICGIGIIIFLVLLVFTLVGDSIFLGLMFMIVFTCIFIFYEPRIIRGEVSADKVSFELSEEKFDRKLRQ